MKLDIQSLHFTARPELNEFVTEKVNKLLTFYPRIESAEVCFKLDKADNAENKICEIKLAVPGNDLFAKRQGKTFEIAVSGVITALKQQIEKLKARNEKG